MQLLQVEQLSQQSQEIIHRYTDRAGLVAGRQAALCAATGVLPWEHPSVDDFEQLAEVGLPGRCCVLVLLSNTCSRCGQLTAADWAAKAYVGRYLGNQGLKELICSTGIRVCSLGAHQRLQPQPYHGQHVHNFRIY